MFVTEAVSEMMGFYLLEDPMIFCYLSLILNFEVFYAAMPWPTSLTAMTASNWRMITSNSSTCAQLEQAVPRLRERCMHVVMMMMMRKRRRRRKGKKLKIFYSS